MKNGQIENPEKTVKKQKANNGEKKQARIWEIIQGVNNKFSNKRVLSIFYAIAAVSYALYTKDSVITGILYFNTVK